MPRRRKRWRPTRFPDNKGEQLYRQIWRVVDGAVADAFAMHGDYLSDHGRSRARQSIVKRVTGAMHGYVEQSTQGRSGESPAANKGGPLCDGKPPGLGVVSLAPEAEGEALAGNPLNNGGRGGATCSAPHLSEWDLMWTQPFDFSQEPKP